MFWRGWTVPSANYLPLNLLKHMGLEVTLPMRRTSILYACLVWLHFPWRLEQMFSAFHKVFFFPPLTCSRQQCYICILFLLTVFKEERANLQNDQQSGAMFQDEKHSLLINLRGSRFPARSIPAAPDPPWPGWSFGSSSNRCKQPISRQSRKWRICVSLLSFLFFNTKD